MKPDQTTINSLAEAIEVAKALLGKSVYDDAGLIWADRLIIYIASLEVEEHEGD